jgi:hypothetical protein
MTDALAGPWWVVAGAALPSLASGLWVFSRWWLERADRNQVDAVIREERLAREVEERRVALSHEHTELFERVKTELLRCQSRLHQVERDRDRAWDLARYWNQRAHDLRHAALNAQAIVAGFCARESLDLPEWPDTTVTTLEEPRR